MSDAKIVGELNAANMTGNVGNGIVRYDLEQLDKKVDKNGYFENFRSVSDAEKCGMIYAESQHTGVATLVLTPETDSDVIFILPSKVTQMRFRFKPPAAAQKTLMIMTMNRSNTRLLRVRHFADDREFMISSDAGTHFGAYDDTSAALLDNLTYLFASYKDVLSKTNTETYTPTADYHPATKKYVDDTVKSTHANKSVLDSITQQDISLWNKVKPLRTVADITLDEETNIIVVDKDMDGNAFELEDIYITMTHPVWADAPNATCTAWEYLDSDIHADYARNVLEFAGINKNECSLSTSAHRNGTGAICSNRSANCSGSTSLNDNYFSFYELVATGTNNPHFPTGFHLVIWGR